MIELPELTKEHVVKYLAEHGVSAVQKALTGKSSIKWKVDDVTPEILDKFRRKKLGVLSGRVPGLLFYCREVIRGNRSWIGSAPRKSQLFEASNRLDLNENLILFGKKSGVGKSTTAHLLAYRMMFSRAGLPLYPDLEDDYYPLSYTGSRLFSEFSLSAAKSNSTEFLKKLNSSWLLVIDDLDKVTGTVGQPQPEDSVDKLPKFLTETKQQLFFEMVEARTTALDDKGGSCPTILVLNGRGRKLLEKFGDGYREYLERRLKERFRHINFDPIVKLDESDNEESSCDEYQ